MPIEHYGVWRGTITQWFPDQKDDDHGHISFTDDSGREFDCAVNVSSLSPDSRLVYWFNTNFQHPITARLADLSREFRSLDGPLDQGPDGLALDFLRDNLVRIQDGIILGHDGLGGKKDILDYLDPILTQAKQASADIFLFGQLYWPKKDGIHDIHMNQGSADFTDASGRLRRFSQQNGIWQDGGIILRFPDDGHWEAIFLGFASQASQTDDDGQPAGPTFAQVLEQPPPVTPGGAGGGEDDEVSGFVSIQAALVNPIGPDGNPTSGEKEHVFLMNTSTEAVSIAGWTIVNGAGQSFKLPQGTAIRHQDKENITMPQNVPLSNKGGSIVLKGRSGQVVDKVEYSREQAQVEGRLLYFKQRS